MKISRHTSLILGGCTGITYLIGSFISLYTTDHWGRRLVLMWTSAGLSMCFAIASILLSLETVAAAYGAAAMVFLFQTFLGIGWHPVAWFYPTEINTTRLRSKAAAITAASNWMTTFVVVKITPIAIGRLPEFRLYPHPCEFFRLTLKISPQPKLAGEPLSFSRS